ncbi:MAG: hypothetical protein LBQ27_05555 [Clostridiales bacterium]|jgi:hypothetical protein|nr:hypothetical protein [Clostridiales bacterium]
MIKKQAEVRNEPIIKEFKNIRILESGKKRNANFYITGKRIILKDAKGKKGIFFGEIELDDIERAKQKINVRFGWNYLVSALFFAAFILLSYYKPEAEIFLYLMLPAVLILNFSGLIAGAEKNPKLFFATFIMVCFNIIIMQAFKNYMLVAYYINGGAAVYFFTAGIKPIKTAKLEIFIVLKKFKTYGDLVNLLKTGLIDENNDDFVDNLLSAAENPNGSYEDKKEEKIKRKNILSNLFSKKEEPPRSDKTISRAYTNIYSRGENKIGLVRSRVEICYIYDGNSEGLYNTLCHVLERKTKKYESARLNGGFKIVERKTDENTNDYAS